MKLQLTKECHELLTEMRIQHAYMYNENTRFQISLTLNILAWILAFIISHVFNLSPALSVLETCIVLFLYDILETVIFQLIFRDDIEEEVIN